MIINGLDIRQATIEQSGLILEFIKAIAKYEKLSHEVITNEETIKESLFGKEKVAEAVIGYYNDIPVGYAIYFYNFSTFIGRPGIYLEDVFVYEKYRGNGFGKAFLIYLARLAKEKTVVELNGVYSTGMNHP